MTSGSALAISLESAFSITGWQSDLEERRRRRRRRRRRGLQGGRDPTAAVVLPRRRILHPRRPRVHLPGASGLGQRRHGHDEDHREVVRIRLGVDEAVHAVRSGSD